MRIFVAGASGVIGRRLLPKLAAAGHDVTGLTHRAENMPHIEAAGARAVVADIFDRDSVMRALEAARPDVVIHQLTALKEWNLEDNANIRKTGTRHLVDAALAAGAKRMTAQSIAWAYEPDESPASETDGLDLRAAPPRSTTIEGVAALEQAVQEMPSSVILRYGMLYGPDTWYAPDGLIADRVRRREMPATDGVTSFLHVEDAAQAAVLALDWPDGIVNIVDDEPAAGTEWLPHYAALLGAPAPELKPGRGGWERGASNAKARREYGWTPIYGSWRTGFEQSLAR
ncbi:MAG: NAD(P)-dependent oxidoreductase [Thermobacillus sp.]|uniref:NAD-dependent epimerase/dehydratase family protein n=1 Tax=Thermobacillus sp. TaxID=2108467 RepID=UPI000E3B3AC1|nr:NAD(P)-dependent oxidoreductase [Thermobacillus sp.]REK52378.1 MAG: NAD(P)-dependent oxidoreductase [Thermobacillus sp.]